MGPWCIPGDQVDLSSSGICWQVEDFRDDMGLANLASSHLVGALLDATASMNIQNECQLHSQVVYKRKLSGKCKTRGECRLVYIYI